MDHDKGSKQGETKQCGVMQQKPVEDTAQPGLSGTEVNPYRKLFRLHRPV